MKTLIRNIGQVAGIVEEGVLRKEGVEMSRTGTLDNAWILIDNERIAGFGPMEDCPSEEQLADLLPKNTEKHSGNEEALRSGIEIIDAEGGMVIPAFCDSHTHIVFAGTREQEFLDKIEGKSYAEIAAHGGGILNSADLLHETPEDELYRQAMGRVNEMIAKGTGAIEIKSGYGLTTEDELKILRVIRRIRETSPAIIRATFLGAHAVGRAFTGRQEDYVDYVCDDMIPAIASADKGATDGSAQDNGRTDTPLADFIDVFCESGFFTVGQTDRILSAGECHGMRVKLHANQLAVSGGVQVGVKHNALSVDHLESTTDEEIIALGGIPGLLTSRQADKNDDAPKVRSALTMPTMLPGASFFLRMQYGRALDYINSGLGIALASDYNPGSSPCGDMRFIMALGCIQMRLTPVQALNACTLNSAYAMGVSDIAGSIATGKLANLIITKRIPSLTWIPYCHQTPFISKVLLRGKVTVRFP